jgi:hypothetical protein
VVGVDAITVGFVELFIMRVVYQECVRGGRSANHNAVHGVGLVVGTLLVTVIFVMEITKGEQENPSPFVVAAKPMHYLCSRCKGCLIFMGV